MRPRFDNFEAMHSPTPARSGAKLSHRLRSWGRRLQRSRSLWIYLVMAVLLLAVSQVLWLWHSWPVREVLDAEQMATGGST